MRRRASASGPARKHRRLPEPPAIGSMNSWAPESGKQENPSRNRRSIARVAAKDKKPGPKEWLFQRKTSEAPRSAGMNGFSYTKHFSRKATGPSAKNAECFFQFPKFRHFVRDFPELKSAHRSPRIHTSRRSCSPVIWAQLSDPSSGSLPKLPHGEEAVEPAVAGIERRNACPRNRSNLLPAPTKH